MPVFVQPAPGQHLPEGYHAAAIVCFALTEQDQNNLWASGALFVRAIGQTHPPISVHATNPITFSEPAEAK